MSSFQDFLSFLTAILDWVQQGIFRTKTYLDVVLVLKITCDYTQYPQHLSYFALQMSTDETLRCEDGDDIRARLSFKKSFMAYEYSSCIEPHNKLRIMQFYGMMKHQGLHYEYLRPFCFVGYSERNYSSFEPAYEYTVMPIDFGTRALVKYFTSEINSSAPFSTMGVIGCTADRIEMRPNISILDREWHLVCKDDFGYIFTALLLWTRERYPICSSYSGSGDIIDIVVFYELPKNHLFFSHKICVSTRTQSQFQMENFFPELYTFRKDLLSSSLQELIQLENSTLTRIAKGAYAHRSDWSNEYEDLTMTSHYLHVSCSCSCRAQVTFDSDDVFLDIENGYSNFRHRRIQPCEAVAGAAKRRETSIVSDVYVSRPCYIWSEKRREGKNTVASFLMEASLFHYNFATERSYECDISMFEQLERRCSCDRPSIVRTIRSEQFLPRLLRGYKSFYLQCYCTSMDGGATILNVTVHPTSFKYLEKYGVLCYENGGGCVSFVEITVADWKYPSQLTLGCTATHRTGRKYVLTANVAASYRQDVPKVNISVSFGARHLSVNCWIGVTAYLHGLVVIVGRITRFYQLSVEAGVLYNLKVSIDDLESHMPKVRCRCMLHTAGGIQVESVETITGNPRFTPISIQLLGKISRNLYGAVCRFHSQHRGVVYWQTVSISGETSLSKEIEPVETPNWFEANYTIPSYMAVTTKLLICNVKSPFNDVLSQSHIYLAYQIGVPEVNLIVDPHLHKLHNGDPYYVNCNYSAKAFNSPISFRWNVKGADVRGNSTDSTCIIVPYAARIEITCTIRSYDVFSDFIRLASQPFTAAVGDVARVYIFKPPGTCSINTGWICELYCILPPSTFSESTTVYWYENGAMLDKKKPDYRRLQMKDEREVFMLSSIYTAKLMTHNTSVTCERVIDVAGLLPLRSREMMVFRPREIGSEHWQTIQSPLFIAAMAFLGAAIVAGVVIMFFVCVSDEEQTPLIDQLVSHLRDDEEGQSGRFVATASKRNSERLTVSVNYAKP